MSDHINRDTETRSKVCGTGTAIPKRICCARVSDIEIQWMRFGEIFTACASPENIPVKFVKNARAATAFLRQRSPLGALREAHFVLLRAPAMPMFSIGKIQNPE